MKDVVHLFTVHAYVCLGRPQHEYMHQLSVNAQWKCNSLFVFVVEHSGEQA